MPLHLLLCFIKTRITYNILVDTMPTDNSFCFYIIACKCKCIDVLHLHSIVFRYIREFKPTMVVLRPVRFQQRNTPIQKYQLSIKKHNATNENEI